MGQVTCDVQGHVATITLDNEAKLNAMQFAMWTGLSEHLQRLAAAGDVRAVILRGAGERAFVSGADISEFESNRNDESAVARYDVAVADAQSALSAFPVPVIAAISGICYGGGLGLALACDLRLASESSRFRMPAARLGLGYATKNMVRMVEVLGAVRAAELTYTARVVNAADALRLELVSETCADVFERALAVANEIAANAPLTVRAAKLAIRAVTTGDASLVADADAAVDRCFASADYIEGRRAFMEKRPPSFQNR